MTPRCTVCGEGLGPGDIAANIWSGGIVGKFRNEDGILEDEISYIDSDGRAEMLYWRCIDAVFSFIDTNLRKEEL